MTEVPNASSIFDIQEEDSSLRLHDASLKSKSSLQKPGDSSVLNNSNEYQDNDSSFDPNELDTSGVFFPPNSRTALKDHLRYSADNECSSGEDQDQFNRQNQENSVELDQIVELHSQRSPYYLRSSISSQDSSCSEPDREMEAVHQEKQILKKRRDTLGPNDFSSNRDNKSQVFTKTFKGILKDEFSFLPTVTEFEEDAKITAGNNNGNTLNTAIKELQGKINMSEDPYVLNINVHIPREFGEKEIPLNVNIVKEAITQRNALTNLPNEDYKSINSSINESLLEPKSSADSTMLSESDVSGHTLVDENIGTSDFESQSSLSQGFQDPVENILKDIPAPEISPSVDEPLNVTLPISEKNDNQDKPDNLEHLQPGPSGITNLPNERIKQEEHIDESKEPKISKPVKKAATNNKATVKKPQAKKIAAKPKKNANAKAKTSQKQQERNKGCKHRCCCSQAKEKKNGRKKQPSKKEKNKASKQKGKSVKAANRKKTCYDRSSDSESDCSVCDGILCGRGKYDSDSSDYHTCKYCCSTSSTSSDSSSDYDS